MCRCVLDAFVGEGEFHALPLHRLDPITHNFLNYILSPLPFSPSPVPVGCRWVCFIVIHEAHVLLSISFCLSFVRCSDGVIGDFMSVFQIPDSFFCFTLVCYPLLLHWFWSAFEWFVFMVSSSSLQ